MVEAHIRVTKNFEKSTIFIHFRPHVEGRFSLIALAMGLHFRLYVLPVVGLWG